MMPSGTFLFRPILRLHTGKSSLSLRLRQGDFAEAAQSLAALSKAHAKNAHVFDLLAKAYSGLGNKKTEAQKAEVESRATVP
jgi:predicted Zn-dependent protease